MTGTLDLAAGGAPRMMASPFGGTAMDLRTRRERIKAVVLEQEQMRVQIEQLTARRAELDSKLDRLLGDLRLPKKDRASSRPLARVAKARPPAAVTVKKPKHRHRETASRMVAPSGKAAQGTKAPEQAVRVTK